MNKQTPIDAKPNSTDVKEVPTRELPRTEAELIAAGYEAPEHDAAAAPIGAGAPSSKAVSAADVTGQPGVETIDERPNAPEAAAYGWPDDQAGWKRQTVAIACLVAAIVAIILLA